MPHVQLTCTVSSENLRVASIVHHAGSRARHMKAHEWPVGDITFNAVNSIQRFEGRLKI